MDINDDRHPANKTKYNKIDKKLLSTIECLKDTVERFIPYWNKTIKLEILKNQKVLIVAYGNSLRALVKYLDHLSDAEILKVNILTGISLVYDLNENFEVLAKYYLRNEDEINKIINSVAN